MRSTVALFILCISVNAYSQHEKLIFAVDIIRHGDRTPTHELPNAPYPWSGGLGQLTPTGMNQEFKLGSEFHKRYILDTNLLPSRYSKETIYVRSSDFDRTLMSAQCALMGLYPPGNGPMALQNSNIPALPGAYQVIPVHTVPMEDDDLLVPNHDPQKFNEIMKQHVANRADWQKKTTELQPQFKRWSQLTGFKVTDLADIIHIADNLYIRKLNQLPLPNDMTEQDAQTIMDAGQWAFTTAFKPNEVGSLTGRRLVTTIADYMHQVSEQKTKLKFVLFSGHDTTILSVLSALRAPLTNPPRYASDLNFSMYDAGVGKYVVKVTLNGKTVQIPACNNKECTLKQFEAYISHLT